MDTLDVSVKYLITSITRAAHATGSTTVNLGERIALSVNVFFTPGHVGLVGVAISYAGLQLLPYNQPGSFILGDNERLNFDLGMYLPGPITVRTQNSDSAAHTVQLTWKVQELSLRGQLPVQAAIPLVVA